MRSDVNTQHNAISQDASTTEDFASYAMIGGRVSYSGGQKGLLVLDDSTIEASKYSEEPGHGRSPTRSGIGIDSKIYGNLASQVVHDLHASMTCNSALGAVSNGR